jgi:hypothetical protein
MEALKRSAPVPLAFEQMRQTWTAIFPGRTAHRHP